MPTETPTYDLMLLLSTSVEEDRRAKILGDVETAISGAKGSIVHNADWGTRPLAYRIDHQAEAEYHLLQFTGPASLLESLGHNLGIADGVLRHRIIKVLPGTPEPPAPERVAVPAPPPAPASEADAAASMAPPSPSAAAAAATATESEGEPTDAEATIPSAEGTEPETAAAPEPEAAAAPEASADAEAEAAPEPEAAAEPEVDAEPEAAPEPTVDAEPEASTEPSGEPAAAEPGSAADAPDK